MYHSLDIVYWLINNFFLLYASPYSYNVVFCDKISLIILKCGIIDGKTINSLMDEKFRKYVP